MDMSRAALPPRSPLVTEAIRSHRLYPEYEKHLRSCRVNLIQASEFKDWLSQREHQESSDYAATHPLYPDFIKWMIAEQGGARQCPAGGFPRNFYHWVNGGRW